MINIYSVMIRTILIIVLVCNCLSCSVNNMSFIEDRKQRYLIDTIECVSNETLQITDGTIHVSDGVAHVADHHGECDHEH